MKMKKIFFICSAAVVAFLIIVCVGTGIKHARIAGICDLIRNGETERAIEQITLTPDVNIYSAPLCLRPFFTAVETDLELPLVTACEKGNLEVVAALMNAGADPNQFLKGNWSPIEAVFVRKADNRLEIAKILVENGADVDLYGSRQSALFSELEAIMFCSDLGEKEKTRAVECIQFLLKNGASPTDARGNTVIHYLAYSGYIDLLDMVFQDYSTMVSYQNSKGKTPLMWAVSGGHIESVQYLVAHGADIDTVDSEGKSAYDYAVQRGVDEIADFLKDKTD